MNELLLIVIGMISCAPWLYNQFKRLLRRAPWAAVAVNIVLWLLCVAYLVYETYNPFLYFRF